MALVACAECGHEYSTKATGVSCPKCCAPYDVAFATHLERERERESAVKEASEEKKRQDEAPREKKKAEGEDYWNWNHRVQSEANNATQSRFSFLMAVASTLVCICLSFTDFLPILFRVVAAPCAYWAWTCWNSMNIKRPR